MKMNRTERRILAALLLESDNNGLVEATLDTLSQIAGYTKSGGSTTYAINMLETRGYVKKVNDKYLVLA